MRSYLFASQVILVSCFLFFSLAACVGSEKETAVPATQVPAEATIIPAVTATPPGVVSATTPTAAVATTTPGAESTVQPTARPSSSPTSFPTATSAPTATPTPTPGAEVMTSHRDGILSVAFSPDGQMLASAGEDRIIRLWRLDDPTAPVALTSHEEPVACRNDSAFVLDVTIPDGTHVAPGASFTKTWRIRNSGTCTWYPTYRIIFISGEQMNGPQSIPLRETVPPGSEVDISIDLIAPSTDGTYRGGWQLMASPQQYSPFGAKPYVEIVVP